jgi:integrase
MACIRKRRGKWVVDYRDAAGVRRWVTCRTHRDAEAVLEKALRESRNPIIPVVDPDITIKAYSERWLGVIPVSLKPRTVKTYSDALRLHLLPLLGAVKVRQLHRGQIKALLAKKLTDGLSRGTVRILHATIRAMLNAALEDGVIAANPADKLGRHLKLVPATATRQEEIKAMTREQLAAFLTAAGSPEAAAIERRHVPLFLLLARTGMRVGEAFALQWPDVDFEVREIRVARAFSDGRLECPDS